jgi:hypothetical protein
MESPRNIGQQGLADFLRSMLPKEAHWYSIILPTLLATEHSLHHQVFPSLSSLLNLDEVMMLRVLQTCGLSHYKTGTGFVYAVDKWNDFFKENMLDEVEVTHYSPIGKKKQLNIRIGCWIKSSRGTSAEVWSQAIKGNVTTPRLRITALENEFAKHIGEKGIMLSHLSEELASDSSDEDDVSESKLEAVDKQVGVEQVVILPEQKEYPLLHKLYLLNPYSKMDALVAEVVKLHKNSSITYQKGHNTDGVLLSLPSY